jgi:sugar lactone lactonase YvrE
VTSDGRIRTIEGTGSSGYGAVGAMPFTVALRGPGGICTDRTGTLYVVDSSNHRVLRIPVSGVVQKVAGNGSPGDGGQANLAQLNQPAACQVDSYGNLYIADTLNHRIRKVSVTGAISTVAGTGTAGFTGDEAAATAAQLSGPMGIAADDTGNLYIADTGNHRVRLITPDGVIHTVAGVGTPGLSCDQGVAASAQLHAPAG